MAQGQYLSEKEIDEFLTDPDNNNNGYMEYHEMEHTLDEVHKEIAPDPKLHHLHHEDRKIKGMQNDTGFCGVEMATDKNPIPRKYFADNVRGWRIPSIYQDQKAEEDHKEYMRLLSWGRRFRAY